MFDVVPRGTWGPRGRIENLDGASLRGNCCLCVDDTVIGARPVVHRPTREMSPVQALVSRISALVPLYDFATAKEYAERLLYVQVVLCVFAALSWGIGGVAHLSFGMAILALVAFEVGSARLLKMYAVSQVGLWFVDVLWLPLGAPHRPGQGASRVRAIPAQPPSRPTVHRALTPSPSPPGSRLPRHRRRRLRRQELQRVPRRPSIPPRHAVRHVDPSTPPDFGVGQDVGPRLWRRRRRRGRRRALRPTRRRPDAIPSHRPRHRRRRLRGAVLRGGTHIVGGDADGYRPSILPDATGAPNNPAARARNLRERGARTETDDRTRRTTERGVPRSRSLDAMRTRCRPKRSRRRVASREDVTPSQLVCGIGATRRSSQSPSSVANPTF